jgi:DNA polymerase-3 subunit beta
MLFSLSTRQCIELMDIASRFVAKNTTLPILSNIYMQVSAQDLTIKSTDMEKFVHITLPLVGECTEGAITVDAKTLFEILRVLDEETLSIKVNMSTQQITISTARDTFTIKGIDAAEFAVLPEIKKDGEIALSAHDFSAGIAAVEYTVLEKNFTPIFT